MKFTQLRLAGFKSFVDPTDLRIDPGLTGVIGPNGCGKSNLLEALRWVMGATSAKSLRGDGMEDVIFSGTDARPSRNHAEVVLTVDNEDKLAPARFNDADSLEITRRITRGAGSAYKINGEEVRAKDVQLLFMDAGTGANSPALVRQGQISELIAAKPQNRRRILEEAAGVSGLRAPPRGRAAAERRRSQSRQAAGGDRRHLFPARLAATPGPPGLALSPAVRLDPRPGSRRLAQSLARGGDRRRHRRGGADRQARRCRDRDARRG